jgi:hypothetical protein
MPGHELNRLLGELEAELGRNPDLDESERAALADLRHRIGHVLEADEPLSAAEEESPMEPLKTYVDKFETTHPTLTMILGRIADALNKMGI